MEYNTKECLGKLMAIIGPMKSGKTSTIIRLINRINSPHQKWTAIAFRVDADPRYFKPANVIEGECREYRTAMIQSASGEECSAFLLRKNNPVEALEIIASERKNIRKKIGDISVVFFDEGNFYDYRLIPVIETLLHQGKGVVVSGLDKNFRGEPYGTMARIIEMAGIGQDLKYVIKPDRPNCRFVGDDGLVCDSLADYTVRLLKKPQGEKGEGLKRLREVSVYLTSDDCPEGVLSEGGYAVAPYYAPLFVPEKVGDNVHYTVACESCFKKFTIDNETKQYFGKKETLFVYNEIKKGLVTFNALEKALGKFLDSHPLSDILSGLEEDGLIGRTTQAFEFGRMESYFVRSFLYDIGAGMFIPS